MTRVRAAVFLAVVLLAGGTASAAGEALGRLGFPNSGSPGAQEAFLRGVLLLHSFEYDDAREAFREARAIDPGFAMAAWGEAMTHNHPLWREQDRDAARAALGRLAPTPEARLEKAPTRREKDFLTSVEILYGEGDKVARDVAYSESLGRMVEKDPHDLEARSFYALSILGTAQGQREIPIYMKAAAQAEEVYRVSPEHPGALHYLIHSYDDPVHAVLGLRAARVYARVAPAATHAQHMISHIYVALGSWDETVDSNEKAVAVSEERARSKGLPAHRRSHHSLHWLQYAYMQQGRYADALRMLEKMTEDVSASDSEENRWYHALMRAGWLVETSRSKDLPGPAALEGISMSGAAAGLFTEGLVALNAWEPAAAAGRFADGLSALSEGNRAAAEKALATIREGSRQAGESSAHADCGTKALDRNSPSDLAAADVVGKELEALIAWESGKKEDAVRLLNEAVALEEAMAYDFGPPLVVKPSHELLGEILQASGRDEEALAAFTASLERAPRRALSLLGHARSATRLGREEAARESWALLAEIWRNADPDLPALAEVKRHTEEARRAAR